MDFGQEDNFRFWLLTYCVVITYNYSLHTAVAGRGGMFVFSFPFFSLSLDMSGGKRIGWTAGKIAFRSSRSRVTRRWRWLEFHITKASV